MVDVQILCNEAKTRERLVNDLAHTGHSVRIVVKEVTEDSYQKDFWIVFETTDLNVKPKGTYPF